VVNAAHARYLEVRRLLLIGRIDEAERTLAELDPAALPPASRTAHELVVAGIAIRRLRTKAARAALARAKRAAHHARIPARRVDPRTLAAPEDLPKEGPGQVTLGKLLAESYLTGSLFRQILGRSERLASHPN
jgi:hypothetical protein